MKVLQLRTLLAVLVLLFLLVLPLSHGSGVAAVQSRSSSFASSARTRSQAGECGGDRSQSAPPAPPLPPGFSFAHPGVLVGANTLADLKRHADSGREPWASILTTARNTQWLKNYTASPRATVECGSYDKPSLGCGDERRDAAAAYIHALLFAASGDVDTAHAAKAVEIMDAWSAVLRNHTNSNAPLQAAWAGAVFPRAAEIIRHSKFGGWSAARIERFESMLTSAYLPLVIDGCFGYNGNWELSMAEATMSIAVFTEDKAAMAVALQLWRGRVPGYFYLSSDGPTPLAPDNSPEGKESVVANWHGQRVFRGHDGLCQETCRDMGHTQMGLASAVNAAETALHQGFDLYAEQATRLTAAMEFHAKLALPNASQAGTWLCNNAVKGIGHAGPTWEIAYNHFANRRGLTNLSNTAAVVGVVRPTGVALQMVMESLSHGDADMKTEDD